MPARSLKTGWPRNGAGKDGGTLKEKGPGKRVVVTGAGGFIGHHLVTFLKQRGCSVRGVDLKHPQFDQTDADEFLLLDLRRWENRLAATFGIDEVYALAADMGGVGFISNHHAEILHNISLISIHTLESARQNGAARFLYTSSARVYPEYLQETTDVVPLQEDDSCPAQLQLMPLEESRVMGTTYSN